MFVGSGFLLDNLVTQSSAFCQWQNFFVCHSEIPTALFLSLGMPSPSTARNTEPHFKKIYIDLTKLYTVFILLFVHVQY